MRTDGSGGIGDNLAALAAQCQYDPWQWCELAWDWGYDALAEVPGPRVWQGEINQTITNHLEDPELRHQPLLISVASGHGIGKSAEMGMISNWAMSCWPNARVVITANTMKQLRTKTVPEVIKWFKSSITESWFDPQAETIKVNENWRTDFASWSAHNTEAFAGLHNKGSIILILFDEASAIDPKVWEVAEGALTDENTTIIWIAFGNPTQSSGRFRECFRRFKHRWHTWHIDSRDVEGTNKKQLQRIVDDYGIDSDIVKVRVRGMFPSSSMRQFISTEIADRARTEHVERLRPEGYNFAPVILGVDPAWTGEDTTEIYLRQGNYSKHLLTWARNDNDVEVANRIAEFQDEYGATAVFIDQGHGTGIYSVGQTMGRSWQLIPFGSKSGRSDCLNKRMEIWYLLREWLKHGGAIDPKNDMLFEDLIGPELVARVDGRYQLESKDDMKARGLLSPNQGDALALTFAFPVDTAHQRMRDRESHTARADIEYNPLARERRRR